MEQGLIVYLADDHELVAQGIASLLRQLQNVSQVKVFKNGLELYNECLIQKPYIVFLDIEMPVMDGRETLAKLKGKFPEIKCFMLSMLNEKAIIQDCIDKGANGYLNKDCKVDELNEAITSVEIYYSKEVLRELSGTNKSKIDSYHLNEPLSEREKEVLKLFCDGLSPKEIADKIFLSPRTVETHKCNIMNKLNVNSVGKLISVALKNKLV
jgi:two-component system, NarL family, response regulator DegU